MKLNSCSDREGRPDQPTRHPVTQATAISVRAIATNDMGHDDWPDIDGQRTRSAEDRPRSRCESQDRQDRREPEQNPARDGDHRGPERCRDDRLR